MKHKKPKKMTTKQITEANNELLTAICEHLQIPIEQFPNSQKSIGGGGVSRPTREE